MNLLVIEEIMLLLLLARQDWLDARAMEPDVIIGQISVSILVPTKKVHGRYLTKSFSRPDNYQDTPYSKICKFRIHGKPFEP
jgi:hypothetical protein